MAKAKTNITPAEREYLTEVLESIAAGLGEESFEVDVPIMATVKYETGAFKKKDLMTTQEFFPAYGYMGVSGAMMMCFSPADTQEWEFIELKPQEVDKVFPLFGSAVAKKFGVEGEEFPKVLKAVVAKREAEEQERAKKEAEEAEQNYDGLETFGMF